MQAMFRWFLIAATTAGVLCAGRAVAADSPADRPQPLLEIEQKMPDTLESGSPLQVEITVRNAGAAAAEGVTVTDRLPAGYDLLGAAPAPERAADGLVWRLGKLAPGEQSALRVRLGPKPGENAGEPRNAVDVVFQARAASVCTCQVTRPELSLKVTAPEAVFTGQIIPFRIVIGNGGPAAARDATLHAVLGQGLTNPKGKDLEAGVGGLAPGESRVINLTATAARAGDLCGSFALVAQGVAPIRREVVCRAEDDRLNVKAAGPAVLRPQFTGLFGLTVTNDGASAARQVALTAVVPDGLAFVRASDDAAYDSAKRIIRWDLGDLQPGERRELAWNGTAQAAGELKAVVRLAAGSRTRREITWAARVVEEGAARPAAGVAAKTPGE